MKSYQCTFIHTPNLSYTRNQNYGLEFMPCWAFTLAKYIPTAANFTISLFDFRFDDLEDIETADLFLFSGINQDMDQILAVRSCLKSKFPTAITIIGGPITWSFDQSSDLHLLKDFDHIFIGEGEEIIGDIVTKLSRSIDLPHVIHHPHKFDLDKAGFYHQPFIDKHLHRYYGVIIEVSRGCPFLCEFCDIRVMQDNNKTHVKQVPIIIEEMEQAIQADRSQIILACDNFIGDLTWAEELVDEIILMNRRLGKQTNIYTWLTINLAKHHRLMKKMRLAGFDLLFVGIESFNVNSLIETAKVQNTKRLLTDDIMSIQSFGFIVVAGLIFGFDTDEGDCFDLGIKGIHDSGLLSGDPNFLVALPGTPLYRRIKLAGRLRQPADEMSGNTTGGSKYTSNIKFRIPAEKLIDGFKQFTQQYVNGQYQLERLKIYFENIGDKENYIPLERGNSGFATQKDIVKILFKDKRGLAQLTRRITTFLTFHNIFYTLQSLWYILFRVKTKGKFNQYKYWLFSWSSYIMKYKNVKDSDFDIESVGEDFNIEELIPSAYASTHREEIPLNKIKAQQKLTVAALTDLINKNI